MIGGRKQLLFLLLRVYAGIFLGLFLCFFVSVFVSIFAEGEQRAGLLKRLSASELAHQVNAYVVGALLGMLSLGGGCPQG